MTWTIAHRGASDKNPGNTLIAFERALDQKAEGIEFDVHLSADGEIVVVHQPSAGEASGELDSKTLEEIRQMEVGNRKGSRSPSQRVPTLSEVIDLVRDQAQLFIEIERESPELLTQLVNTLREAGMQERAWLFSEDKETQEELRRLAPDMHIRWREGMEGGDFVLTWPERLTEATVAVFRERGMRVFTTIQDQVPNNRAREIAIRMAELNIDGIICNRIALVREAIDSVRARSTTAA